MSAVKGVNRTKMDTPTPANRLKPGESDGRVKTFQDTYEAAALASGSTIDMGPVLPVGAIILEVILDTDNLTNSTDLSVGDDEVSDRYISATDHGSAALVTRSNNIAGRNYQIDLTTASTPDTQIVITTATGEATGTIKLTVFFTND